MLVLSRRAQESIDIPEAGVRITVLSVKGNRVRLGIDAPGDVEVIRSELQVAAQILERREGAAEDSSVPFSTELEPVPG